MRSTETAPGTEEFVSLYREWHELMGHPGFDEKALREEWAVWNRHRRAFNLQNIRTNVEAARRTLRPSRLTDASIRYSIDQTH